MDSHATCVTQNKAITLQQQQHQHQILPTQGSHRPVREIPPSPPLPFMPPQLPAGPVPPGTVTQTGRMRPFPSQAQRLAPADVSPCPCSASCFEHGGSGQDPGRLGASRDATWRLGRRGPCDPEPMGEASRGYPCVLAQCCKNTCMVGKGKKIRLTLQLVSYWPRQVRANSTVPVARWAASRLLLGGEAQEKGTPRRDAPAQHPLLRPGPQPGAGQSWSVPHGAATRAEARKQLQAGGRPAKGRRVLCQ